VNYALLPGLKFPGGSAEDHIRCTILFISTRQTPLALETLFVEKSGSHWTVRFGDRVLDYTRAEMGHVEIDSEHGRIKLFDPSGSLISNRHVPSIETLVAELDQLSGQQIGISRELASEFIRLFSSKSLEPADLELIQHELEQLIPEDVLPPKTLNLINADLNLAKLLNMLPAEMIQMTLDFSLENMGEPMVSLQNLLSRVDAIKDPEITAFLAGRKFTFSQILPLLEELVSRTQVLVLDHPGEFQVPAINQLLDWLADHPVPPALGGSTPPALHELFQNTAMLQIPEFSLFDSLESMEHEWYLQNALKMDRNPSFRIEQILLENLSPEHFPELHRFLGTRMPFIEEIHGTELQNLLQTRPLGTHTPLEPIPMRQIQILLNKAAGYSGWEQAPHLKTAELEVLRKFAQFSPLQKTGFWLLDHLSVKQTPLLTSFFDPAHPAGLFTRTVRQEIKQLMHQSRFEVSRPPLMDARNGLDLSFLHERFGKLLSHLSGTGKLPGLSSYRPLTPLVRELVEQMEPPIHHQKRESLSRIWKNHISSTLPKKLEQALEIMLKQEFPLPLQDKLFNALLRRKFPNFRTLRLLDQTMGLKQALQAEHPDMLPARMSQVQSAIHGEPIERWHLLRMQGGERAELLPDSFSAKSNLPEFIKEMKQTLLEWPRSFQEKLQFLNHARILTHFEKEMTLRDGQSDPSNQLSQSNLKAWVDDFMLFLTQRGKTNWTRGFPASGKHPIHENLIDEQGQMTDKAYQALKDAGFSNHAIKDVKELLTQMERHHDVQPEKELMQKLVQLMGKHNFQGESMQGIPEKMLHFMDRMHEWNRFQNLNQAPLFFCIPLEGQNPQKLEILYKPLHNAKENKKFLVVLHLDFEGTGHLRADILKENQKLTATLWAGSKKMEEKLKQKLPMLKSRFLKAGLEHVHLSVVESVAHAERKPAELVKSYHDGVFDLEA